MQLQKNMSSKDKMDQIEYNGRDNLEVMQEAKNYNCFLLHLILAQARNNELIVDFGAGSGTFSLPVAAAGNHLICVETDPVLSSNLSDHGLEVVSSLEMLEDGSIDYLYTLNVLEHIEDDDAIVRLWLQKLRPGGRLLVYVPAFEVLFSSMDRKVGHFRRYTKQMLNAKLKQAGFQVTETRYADSIGYLATLIYKAFDNGEGSVNLRMLKVYDRWVIPLSRIFDLIASPFVGKNVYARAVKRT
jgi:SAM-dependent methyltransferase